VSPVERGDWAAAFYRVERHSVGMMMSRRKRRRATELAARFGDPVPEEPHDVVRILDREGRVVFEHHWGRDRPGAAAMEARIVDDLLRLDVRSFRARWAIPPPEEAEERGAGPPPDRPPDALDASPESSA
jgi:hypothetical protein